MCFLNNTCDWLLLLSTLAPLSHLPVYVPSIHALLTPKCGTLHALQMGMMVCSWCQQRDSFNLIKSLDSRHGKVGLFCLDIEVNVVMWRDAEKLDGSNLGGQVREKYRGAETLRIFQAMFPSFPQGDRHCRLSKWRSRRSHNCEEDQKDIALQSPGWVWVLRP